MIEAIIYDNPHTARSQPTSLLKKENTYKKIFDQRKDFRAYLNCCIIHRWVHNSWLKHEDPAVKAKTSNFKLHLSCIVVKNIFKKSVNSFDEIANLHKIKAPRFMFSDSIEFLSSAIDSFLAQNPNANLINIAKSKDFTDYIFSVLRNSYGD